jgi:DNA-binding response OmpR family regulator
MAHRILCVDDEPILTELMGFLIDERLTDCQLVVARGAREAETHLKEKFSLYLIDVMMPGVDGFALAKKIRSVHATTPILMFSAKAEDLEAKSLASGANYFIRKPFDVDELMNLVHDLLISQDRSVGAL